MEERQRILIAPLNWGLGHATRCIPMIRQYLGQGHAVTLASDGDALALLRKEFPNLPYLELPGYDVRYSRSGASLMMAMLSQLPKIKGRINKEEKVLNDYLNENPQDLIISDNRYGIRSGEVRSVIICHQLNLQLGGISKMVNSVHRNFLERFDECWVPDHEDHRLSGELSKAELKIPVKFIGAQSRLEKRDLKKDIPVLAILSGPEPSRSDLDDKLRQVLSQTKGAILVRGKMSDASHTMRDGVRVIGHIGEEDSNDLLNRAQLIICRSGYSSLMDLDVLDCQAILIPTPGQPEQEYLAELHANTDRFMVLKQEEVEQRLHGLISSTVEMDSA